jgi:hypothetical protein
MHCFFSIFFKKNWILLCYFNPVLSLFYHPRVINLLEKNVSLEKRKKKNQWLSAEWRA